MAGNSSATLNLNASEISCNLTTSNYTNDQYNMTNSTPCETFLPDPDYSSFFNPLKIPSVRAIMIVSYSIVFCMCVSGNLTVLFVIMRCRKMRTTTNIFLANLAVADLAVGLFCVIPNLTMRINMIWVLGKTMCKLYYFIQQVSYVSSILILTAVSAERFVAISVPMRCKQLASNRRLSIAVGTIWILSAVYSSPRLVISSTTSFGNDEYCFSSHPKFNYKLYITMNFIILYIIPLILVTGMYSIIAKVLWKSGQLHSNEIRRAEQMNTNNNDVQPKRMLVTQRICQCCAWLCRQTWYKSSAQSDIDLQTPLPMSRLNGENGSRKDKHDTKISVDDRPVGHKALIGSGSKKYIKNTIFEGQNLPKRQLKQSSMCLSCVVLEEVLNNDESTTTSNDDHENESKECDNLIIAQSFECSPQRCEATDVNSIEIAPNRFDNVNENARKSSFHALQTQNESRENVIKGRRKVVRLLVAVIVSFALCVLPYHIQNLWHYYGNMPRDISPYWLIISYLFLYLNSGINPILYAFLSCNFRKSLNEAFSCRKTYPITSKRRSSKSSKSSRLTQSVKHDW